MVLAVSLLAAFFGLVASGECGGDAFFSNVALATTILAAAGSGVAAGCVGVLALRRHDRSLVVIVAITVGVLVILWTAAEVAFPH